MFSLSEQKSPAVSRGLLKFLNEKRPSALYVAMHTHTHGADHKNCAMSD